MHYDRLKDPQTLNLYVYVRNNPLAYIDPTGWDIIQLGRSEDKINKDIDEIKQKLKGGLSEKERGKLEGRLNVLQQELDANKIVGAWLDTLHSVGEATSLKLSDLQVSTDPRGDFYALYEKQGYTKKQAEQALQEVLKPGTDGTVLFGKIYILTTGPGYTNADGFTLPKYGEVPASDMNIYGAAVIGHERYHQQFGRPEPPAYKESLRILMKFKPDAIVNKQWMEAQKAYAAGKAVVPYSPK
jgi:hypothetical protein